MLPPTRRGEKSRFQAEGDRDSESDLALGMREVARTELALWAFYELTKGENPSDDAKRAPKDFQEDVWIQGRRARQALRPFFDRTTHRELQLAEILTEQHPKLAAPMAGVQFERLLKSCADNLSPLHGSRRIGLRMLHNGRLRSGEGSLGVLKFH